jgi:hypothetical protein
MVASSGQMHSDKKKYRILQNAAEAPPLPEAGMSKAKRSN